MNNDEIECLTDEDGNKYYVLKNSSLDLSNIDNFMFPNELIRINNKFYYNNKLVHREDSPSIKMFNGDKSWYKNGLLHREDGPAIEWNNGDKWWCINGKEYTELEFNKYIEKKKLKEELSFNLIKRTDNKTKLKI